MKTIGVVRRIDDLGRIVIPKEIRKSLRIKDGESLEICLDSENIILKKYSELNNLGDFYKNYVDSINSYIKENIIIVDRNSIVAIAGDLKKKYVNKNISPEIDDIIQKRNIVVEKEYKDITLVINNTEKASYIIAPIIVNGDAIGAVIMLSTTRNLDDFDVKTISIASKFLGKYIEE
ncbi:MAG: stage V sporulation T C-terminal domain-containing protein [bacterium]|nr:stage V sporulation T C-terminal domain-containing protein [bacterium]